MRRVLRLNSNAVDVGAFEGGMLRHMRRLAPLGKHWAFEPNPQKFAALSAAFPSVTCLPYALGSASGEVRFYRAVTYPALSGLRERKEVAEMDRTEEITVAMATLDGVLPPSLKIDFIKIDVEGGELGVFEGAVRTLRSSRPVVVFESGLGGADYFGARPEDIHDRLTQDAGLKVSLLEAWLGGGQPLSRSEFAEQFDRSLNYYFVAHP